MAREVMLTTEDNPFDPFDQYEGWLAWDTRAGYHTPAYLARVTISSFDLSEPDQDVALENSIDEIIELNKTLPYKKVVREV